MKYVRKLVPGPVYYFPFQDGYHLLIGKWWLKSFTILIILVKRANDIKCFMSDCIHESRPKYRGSVAFFSQEQRGLTRICRLLGPTYTTRSRYVIICVDMHRTTLLLSSWLPRRLFNKVVRRSGPHVGIKVCSRP